VAAAVEVYRDAMPEQPPPTPAGLRHWMESHPPRGRFGAWVAAEDGEVVGVATAELSWSSTVANAGWWWAGVREHARGRGVGTALVEAAEAHLAGEGARKLETVALGGSPGERLVEARGYARTRTELVQRLAVDEADLSPLAPLEEAKLAEGFRAVPLGEVTAGMRELHALYAAASADMPADDPEDDIRFEDFETHVMGDPELSRDGSFVVLHGERAVSLAFLLVHRERGVALSAMTGTLPEFRGRGLARLAKLAGFRWARDAGLRELATENDAENAAMLSLNRSLGYRVTHERALLTRELAP
jgi:GNAT superfamily N-acetyltransferase